MLFQKTTFERLFPSALSREGLSVATNFGFESGGKRHFVVTVPGKPRIEQGMTVIALLETPDGWGSKGLLGWIDCSDGALVCYQPGWFFVAALCCALHAAILLTQIYSIFGKSEIAALVALSVATFFAAAAVRFFYLSAKALLVRRALVAIRDFSKLSRVASSQSGSVTQFEP